MVGRHSQDVNRIERMAESKGIDIDDIEVDEFNDDNNNQIVEFTVYETKADTEADSIAGKIQKVQNSPMADQQFQDNAQTVLSELKRVASGGEESLDRPERKETDHEDLSDAEIKEDPTASEEKMAEPTNAVDPNAERVGSEPETELLEERQRLEERVAELERQVEEIKEYAEALEGLSKLVDSDSGESGGDG